MKPLPRLFAKPLICAGIGAVVGGAVVYCLCTAKAPQEPKAPSPAAPQASLAAASAPHDLLPPSPEKWAADHAATPPSSDWTFTPTLSPGRQQLQSGNGVASPSNQYTVGFPGRQLEYTGSGSGYPIVVGRRAVDYQDPAATGTLPPGTIDPGATAGWTSDTGGPPPGRIGRNGLLSNPPVDPPSSHGLSYSRAYQ